MLRPIVAMDVFSVTARHRKCSMYNVQQEVKIIWQKAPHGGPIPRLGVCDVYVGGKVRVLEFMIFLTLQHNGSK